MPYPKIWDLIDEFKKCCRTKGWKAYEKDDLIEAESEYHRFFWIRSLHANTFKKVVMDSLCSICEGISIRIVSLSYKAWILIEKPS